MSTQPPNPDPAEDPRLSACLTALRRHSAPTELGDRLRLELSTRLPVANLLRALPTPQAPAVLERLLREDLANEAATVQRQLNGLPRLVAPAALRPRLLSAKRNLRAPKWAGMAAAAVLLLALGLRYLPSEQRSRDWQLASQQAQRPPLRFQLESMEADQLSSLARPLVASLDQGRHLLGGGN